MYGVMCYTHQFDNLVCSLYRNASTDSKISATNMCKYQLNSDAPQCTRSASLLWFPLQWYSLTSCVRLPSSRSYSHWYLSSEPQMSTPRTFLHLRLPALASSACQSSTSCLVKTLFVPQPKLCRLFYCLDPSFSSGQSLLTGLLSLKKTGLFAFLSVDNIHSLWKFAFNIHSFLKLVKPVVKLVVLVPFASWEAAQTRRFSHFILGRSHDHQWPFPTYRVHEKDEIVSYRQINEIWERQRAGYPSDERAIQQRK